MENNFKKWTDTISLKVLPGISELQTLLISQYFNIVCVFYMHGACKYVEHNLNSTHLADYLYLLFSFYVNYMVLTGGGGVQTNVPSDKVKWRQIIQISLHSK